MPLAKSINVAFASLRQQIQLYERLENTDTRADSAAQNAVSFLHAWQCQDGSWAQGAILDTNLTLQALGCWAPTSVDWLTRSGAQGGIESAWNWLDKRQVRGEWENVWNTAGLIQAASSFQLLSRPSVERAIEWLSDQTRTQHWVDKNLPLQHTAQAVLAFSRLGLKDDQSAATEILISQLKMGTPLSAYTAGQVLEALVKSGENTESESVAGLIELVSEKLLDEYVSISNFLDICSSFKGLGAAKGGVQSEDPALQRTLGNFFSPNRLIEDGSWYRDISSTAYALLALTEVRATRRIEAYPAELYRPLETTRLKLHKAVTSTIHERNRVASAGALAAISLAGIIAIGFIQVVGPIDPHLPSSVAWFLIPSGLALAAWFTKYAWTQSSRVLGDK